MVIIMNHYILQAYTEGIYASIGVNGFPVLVDDDGQGRSVLRAVNEWLYRDGNRLTASINWPPERSYQPGAGKLQVSLFLPDPDNDVPQPGELLGELVWPLPEQPEAYPYNLAVDVDVASPPPTTLWQEAAPVTELSPSDEATMLDTADALLQAVAAGRGEDAYQLCAYKYQDDARANGLDPVKLKQVVISQYEQFVKDQQVIETNPLTATDAVFTLLGEGRVVHLTRGNESYAFTVVGAELGAMYELYFANIDGRWRIVR